MDQERDGGRHGDVDMDDLHHFCAPKMIDLLVVALRMMKGKNVWPRKSKSPSSLHLDPSFVRKTCCRSSPFSLLRNVVSRW